MKLVCLAVILFSFGAVSCSDDGGSPKGASSPGEAIKESAEAEIEADDADAVGSYCRQEWDDGEGNADESEEDWVADCIDYTLIEQYANKHIGDIPDAAVRIETADLPASVTDIKEPDADSQWYFLEGPGETVTYIDRQLHHDTAGESFYAKFSYSFGDCDAVRAKYPEMNVGGGSCNPEPD